MSEEKTNGTAEPEAVPAKEKVEKFLTLMKTFGVIDLTRTGSVAMPRK